MGTVVCMPCAVGVAVFNMGLVSYVGVAREMGTVVCMPCAVGVAVFNMGLGQLCWGCQEDGECCTHVLCSGSS